MTQRTRLAAGFALGLASSQMAPAPANAGERGVATALTVGGIGLSSATVWAGSELDEPAVVIGGIASLLITPSLGHVYLGDPVTPGLIVRGASAALGTAGLLWMGRDCPRIADTFPCGHPGLVMSLLGAAGLLVGVVIDLVSVTVPTQSDAPSERMFALGSTF